MKRILRPLLIGGALAAALGLVLLATPPAGSDPGTGKGTGKPGVNCKMCPPEPEGCTFFECTNQVCNYACTDPDGTTYSLTLPKH